jgi:hypothetical protein
VTARERKLTSYLVMGGINAALLIVYLACALVQARHAARFPEDITGREYMIERAGYNKGYLDGKNGVYNEN